MKMTEAVLRFAERSKHRRQRQELFDNVSVQLLTMVKDYLAVEAPKPNKNLHVEITTKELYAFARQGEYIDPHHSKSWFTRHLSDIGIDNHPAMVDGWCRRVYEIDLADFKDRCDRSLPPKKSKEAAKCNSPEAPK